MLRTFAIYFIEKFHLGDLIAVKVTRHEVKRKDANQFSFALSYESSLFDVMSSNFKSFKKHQGDIFQL